MDRGAVSEQRSLHETAVASRDIRLAVATPRQDGCSIRAKRDCLDAAAMGSDRPNRRRLREVPDACDRVVSAGGCEQPVVGAEGEIRDAAGTRQCDQFLSRLHIPEADELARSGCCDESAIVAEARDACRYPLIELADPFMTADIEQACVTVSSDRE